MKKIEGNDLFEIVDCGRDEYPGDGLRLKLKNKEICNTDLLKALGIKVGDYFSISVELHSRLETKRVYLK